MRRADFRFPSRRTRSLRKPTRAYQSNYEYALEYASGDSDEERAANAELILFSEGYTPEYMRSMVLSGYQAEAVQADVEAEIAEVTDEELQAAYEEKLAADEETYTETPTAIESDATDASSVICWRPEGYRAVKHVLVIPEDDVLQAVTDARDALDAAEEELASLEEELAAANDAVPADEEGRGRGNRRRGRSGCGRRSRRRGCAPGGGNSGRHRREGFGNRAAGAGLRRRGGRVPRIRERRPRTRSTPSSRRASRLTT